ncbi:MAG: TonB-dependent receptor [Bacteroidetes bacterium]|nr:TonB-dependent receptor [Bacteroidota bacterium]MCL5737632.1 TonB-dependent receptor [Bacteroidota bacterium]
MKALLVYCVVVCSLSVASFAGTTGKIAGVVKDASTGEPLVGATIQIQGTTLGAATDINGRYFIINIPPGTYTVRAYAIGYTPVLESNVQVNIDLTTQLDFSMKEEAVGLPEVKIVAQRPLVQKDVTASTVTITDQQIRALPVQNLQEVLATQSGVVQDASGGLHLRGGRANETVFIINGVEVNDLYTGGYGNINLNNSSIQELQTITGAFNAEYGNSESGIINITTRQGSDKLEGRVSAYIGDYVSTRTNVFQDINIINPLNDRNIQLSLGGPVPAIPNLRFHFDGRLFNTDGYLYGYRRYAVNPPLDTVKNDPYNFGGFAVAPDSTSPNFMQRVSLNHSSEKNFAGSLTYDITPTLKLNLNTVWQNVDYQTFNHRMMFVPDGLPQQNTQSNLISALLSYSFSNNTFAELQGAYYYQRYQQYVYPNYLDSAYLTPPIYFSYGYIRLGTTDFWEFRDQRMWQLKGDVTSQVDEHNLVKAGFEMKPYRFYYNDYTPSAYIPDLTNNNPNIVYFHNYFLRYPFEGAAFIQDKLEFKEIIVNVGLRYDYFRPDAQKLVNAANPFGPRETVGPSDQWSPRLGVSYPITETAVMYFSYGHFFQVPPYYLIYTNPNFLIESGRPTQNLLGGGNLKPEKTVTYEMGFKQSFEDMFSLDASIYFKNIQNLTGTELVGTTAAGDEYFQIVNLDYGDVKGININFLKRHVGIFGFNLSYTYQVAEGKASDPEAEFIAIANKQPVNNQLVPLNWDQRHTLTFTGELGYPGNWNVGLVAKYGSGLPYTPTDEKGEIIQGQLQNSARMPSTFDVDLYATKELEIMGVHSEVFLRVYNLLDNLNQIIVYSNTGTATYSLTSIDPAVTYALQPAQYQEQVPRGLVPSSYWNNPSYYAPPRLVQVGLSVLF